MKAVIMAGGEGTRLRPLTLSTPKPMLPIANIPMMEHIVRLLREHGFDDIVVTVAFLAQNIRTYFGDGSEFGVRIRYATEDTPLGTAGSVANARAELDERFLVISGDVLTDIDLGAIVDEHDRRGAVATIALKSMENPVDFGIVITDAEGRIERFLEKPTWGEVFSDTINTGIYVLEPEIFDYIGEGSVDFSSDVFPKLLEDGKALFGSIVEDGYWEDVGTLESYVSAHSDVLDGAVRLSLPGFEMSDHVWVGEGADVHPDARVDGPCVIGHDCRVGGRRPPRRLHRAGRQRARRCRRLHRALGRARQQPSWQQRAAPRRDRRSARRPALRRTLRGGRGARRRVLRRRTRRDQPGREGLSVQDRRARRDDQRVAGVGIARRPQPVRARRRHRPGQRRPHA